MTEQFAFLFAYLVTPRQQPLVRKDLAGQAQMLVGRSLFVVMHAFRNGGTLGKGKQKTTELKLPR